MQKLNNLLVVFLCPLIATVTPSTSVNFESLTTVPLSIIHSDVLQCREVQGRYQCRKEYGRSPEKISSLQADEFYKGHMLASLEQEDALYRLVVSPRRSRSRITKEQLHHFSTINQELLSSQNKSHTWVTSFAQLSGKEFAVSRFQQYCIVSLNLGKHVSVLAGDCQTPGLKDGSSLKSARFTNITAMTVNPSRKIIVVADTARIRLIYLEKNKVRTLSDLGTGSPILSFAFSHNGERLLVGSQTAIHHFDVNCENKTLELLSGSEVEPGNTTGDLEISRYRGVVGLLWLTDEIVIAADNGNNQLRILHLRNKSVSSVCNGKPLGIDDNETPCILHEPAGIALVKTRIYISTKTSRKLMCLNFSIEDSSTTSPQRVHNNSIAYESGSVHLSGSWSLLTVTLYSIITFAYMLHYNVIF